MLENGILGVGRVIHLELVRSEVMYLTVVLSGVVCSREV